MHKNLQNFLGISSRVVYKR